MNQLNKNTVDQEEEEIKTLIRKLPDNQRLTYYKSTEDKIKDPDTYATLNYALIFGLHHFYLKKWGPGIIDLIFSSLGIIGIYIGLDGGSDRLFYIGLFFIIIISIWELIALFNSQIIVQDHNNKVMREELNLLNLF
jgi:TM2 domain-containing membrane protein YozV